MASQPKIVLRNECYKGKTVLNTVNLNNVEFADKNMNNAFKDCTNLTSVINIDAKITTLNNAFAGCTSLKNDIRIESKNITSCEGAFTNNNYLKKVYIHYYDTNNEPTTTYNTFLAAGYDEVGSKDGIMLEDIDSHSGSDIEVFRYNSVPNYKTRYGFSTDDKTLAVSLTKTTQSASNNIGYVNFYNRSGQLVDSFSMPNNGGIDGLNATEWQPLLGCVGLDMPTVYGYSSFEKSRFFKYNNKYWAYYLSLPFYIWYSFYKDGYIYCLPCSPWQESVVTLNVYKQIELNSFTRSSNSADTNNCYPVYFSHTNNIIYSLYMAASEGANSKYILNIDNNYNITTKSSGFTINGDEFKVTWYSDTAKVIRELNFNFTPGNIQLTKLKNTNGNTQWFVISETSNGVLDCNSIRNNNLRSYFQNVFNTSESNPIPELYALPGGFFLAFGYKNASQSSAAGYKVYKFHFNGNAVVDDGIYLSAPTGYTTPINGSKIFVNYLTKEVGWALCKNDSNEYAIITREFSAVGDLPTFLPINNTLTVSDAKYQSSQDDDGYVHIKYIGNEQNVQILNQDIPISVILQFRDKTTNQIISNNFEDLVIPYVNFTGAIATRNMFEYIVPKAGMYSIGFTADQSGNNMYQPAPTAEYEILKDGQVITIDLVPTADMPDTKFTGTMVTWNGTNDPYYTYIRLNDRSYLLAIFYVSSVGRSFALPLTNNFILASGNILTTDWDDGLSPDSTSEMIMDYSYTMPCYGEGYYIAKTNPKNGDHVFTFVASAYNTTLTNIAEISEVATSEAGKAYLDSQNKLHINGIGTFDYNENKSGLIIKD